VNVNEGPVVVEPGAGELQLVGTPVSLDAALARIEMARAAAGDTPVSGFVLSALQTLAVETGLTLRRLLERMHEAGLELVAEAAFDDLNDPARAIEAVNMAGLTLARLTLNAMPHGNPAPVFREVAALQRRVGVLRAFQPLPRRAAADQPTTGYADLRQVALARLLVDNVETIQVDWRRSGPKLAQVALAAGANDLDGVSADPTPTARGRSSVDDARWNIEAAGLQPVERDGRFDLKPWIPSA
jgi:aminodeoxyfutalosine synthase